MTAPAFNDTQPCRSSPHLFYADSPDPAVNRRRNTAAVKICRACPFQNPCLQWALDHDERWGTWGGVTESQRDRMRRGLPQSSRPLTPQHTNSEAADPAVVAQIVTGRKPVTFTMADMQAAIVDLTGRGMSIGQIAKRVGVNGRTVERYRRRASRQASR